MGRPPKNHRLIVEAVVWLDRTGAPWRDLPAHSGPWETVASRFSRWRRQGVWDRVLAGLQADADARGEPDWLLHVVDGSVVAPTSNQHAAGARHRPLAGRPAATATGHPTATATGVAAGGRGRRQDPARQRPPPHAPVHLLAAMDHTSRAVLAQTQVDTTNEIARVPAAAGRRGPGRAGPDRRRHAHPA